MEYKLNISLLSRAECNVLRGLAIIGIFLHNYSHWLNPIVKENEYQYFQRNVDWFAQVLAHPDYLLPLHIVSFFGHYGVPIFLFLSAYGLERKYSSLSTKPASLSPNPTSLSPNPSPMGEGDRNTPSGKLSSAYETRLLGERHAGVGSFISRHFLKLFKMMIVGFVCFIIIDALTPGRWHYTVTQVVAQLGMFNNLLAEPDRNIWPGPYWFFGLMMQLYIVYRLLLYRRHWGGTVGLMVACVAAQYFMGPESEVLNRYRYNFMGGMLPFGLGLLFARYGERVILVNLGGLATWMSLVVTSGFIVSLSNSYWGWHLVPLFVCVASVYFAKALKTIADNALGARLWRMLEWMGTISAALFIIHPVLRKVFIPISRQGDIYAGLLLYVIASIGCAYLTHKLQTVTKAAQNSPNPSKKASPNPSKGGE